ncbi:DUF2770 family protein [Salmonella enterica subsp. enterica serovar Infantis]
MRRLFHWRLNKIREQFLLYVIHWSLLAVMDIGYLLVGRVHSMVVT